MHRLLVLFLLGAASSTHALSVQPPDPLPEVSQLHSEGNTELALEKLDNSTLKDLSPALYHFNRGVLLHALSRYGAAVASFERANALTRGRAEIEEALRASRAELARLIGPARLDGASSPLEKAGDDVPFDPFVVFFAGVSLLGALVVAVQKRSFSSRAAILTYVNIALLVGFLLWKQWMQSHPPAVVVEGVTLRSGPGKDYLEMGNLDAGMKIRVLDRGSSWWKVRFASGDQVAYAPSETLLLLVD